MCGDSAVWGGVAGRGERRMGGTGQAAFQHKSLAGRGALANVTTLQPYSRTQWLN